MWIFSLLSRAVYLSADSRGCHRRAEIIVSEDAGDCTSATRPNGKNCPISMTGWSGEGNGGEVGGALLELVLQGGFFVLGFVLSHRYGAC